MVQSRPRSIEPPSIRQVAEWMRDGTWLDMRIPFGHAERVKIVSLLITFSDERITIEQVWFGADERVYRRQFECDLEDCLCCEPTRVGPLDVNPLERGRSEKIAAGQAKRKAERMEREREIGKRDAQVAEIIIQATLKAFTYLERATFLGTKDAYQGNQYVSHHRHQAMLVMLVMTELSPQEICTKVFAYKSVQPLMTARWKLHGDEGMVAACRKIRGFADVKAGYSTRRSNLETWPELEPITK